MSHMCSLSRRQALLGAGGLAGAAALSGTFAATASANTTDPYYPTFGDTRWSARHYEIGDTIITNGVNMSQVYGATTIFSVAHTALTYVDIDFALDVNSALIDGKKVKFTRLNWRKVRISGFSVKAGNKFIIKVGYNDYPARRHRNDAVNSGLLTGTNTIAFAGEPSAAIYWYPSNDRITNKATYDISISTQRQNAIFGSGDPSARRDFVSSDKRLMVNRRFVVREPSSSYHPSVQVGTGFSLEQGTWNINGQNVPYHIAAQAGMPASLRTDMPRSLRYFSSRYGAYPYSHAGAVGLNVSWGGWGQENVGSIVMRRDKLSSNIAGTLVAHEIAHSWFGNSVTCSSWKDVVLIQEGLAVLLEHDYARAYGLVTPYSMQPSKLAASPGTNGLANMTTYNSAAGVMQELRRTMDGSIYDHSAPRFSKFLRNMATSYRHSHISRAQFKAQAQSAAGKDLGAFWSKYGI